MSNYILQKNMGVHTYARSKLQLIFVINKCPRNWHVSINVSEVSVSLFHIQLCTCCDETKLQGVNNLNFEAE